MEMSNQNTIGSPSAAASVSSSKPADSRSLFLSPQEITSINVKGKEFKVHKVMLVKDSEYFAVALQRQPWMYGTQTLDLTDDIDDIDAFEFGFYVDILYRSYFVRDFKLDFQYVMGNSWKSFSVATFSLWRLGDKLSNLFARNLAEEAFDSLLESKCSIAAWKGLRCQKRAKHYFLVLQKLFDCCREINVPFLDKIAEAAANAPADVFNEHLETLDADLRTAATKKLLKRFEQFDSTISSGTNAEDGPPVKRQRQE